MNIDLELERMCYQGFPRPKKGEGFGSLYQQGFHINYLHGLDFLCRTHIKKDTKILELGCFYGASSLLFSKYSDFVTCVDIEFFPEMKEIVNSTRINFIQENSITYLQTINEGQYDFVYIDTSHDLYTTQEEIKLVYSKSHEGQYISGHDYNTPGVHDAINNTFVYPDIQVYLDSSWVIKKTDSLKLK